MTHIYTAIVIFVLCTSSVFGQETCPTGKPSIKSSCRPSEPCPSDSKCYRKDDKRFCCGELGTFCPTKMHAFNSRDGRNSYSWDPVDTVEKTKWYSVELGGETIACRMFYQILPHKVRDIAAVPFSYTYTYYKELNVLPVDFNASNAASSTPKACSMNSDCNKDNDEFCGAATNPSFLEELDRSGENGAPLRFCYKFQNFGSTNVKPSVKADEKELTGCNNISDCSPTHGSQTFCFIPEEDKDVQIAMNNGSISIRKGLCAFEELTTTSIYWYSLFASVGCTIVFLVLSVSCFAAHRRSSSSSPTEDESSATMKLSKKKNKKKKKKKKKRSKKNNLSKSKTLSKIAEPPTRPNCNADGKPAKPKIDDQEHLAYDLASFDNQTTEEKIQNLITLAKYEAYGKLYKEKLFRDHKEELRRRDIYPPHLARDFHFRDPDPDSDDE